MTRPRTIVTFAIALLIAPLIAFSIPIRPVAAEAPVSYDIAATLDYPSGVATVRERVSYTNRTGATLSTIAFNVTPRHFGAFTLTEMAIDGQTVRPTLADVTLEAPLPTPVPVGGRIDVQIDYRLTVPARANLRFGRAGGITALGNSFPTVQLYRNGAWTRYPYTEIGDAFFTETADYDVTLDVAGAGPQLAVAHSGDLVSRSGNRFAFHGRQIRDFALALSDRYQTRSRTVGGTTISAFYLPEHAVGGAQMLESAAAALAWANARFGEYPWTHLSVAETTDSSGTGQEYPTAVFLASSALTGATGPGSYLDYVVAHEVFHQWFYSLVGNDQVSEPWLDEGPTTHLSYLYLRDTAPAGYSSMWANMVAGHRQAVATYGDRPLDTTIYDYPSDPVYFSILYRKGALFLDEVRKLLGDDGYYALLRNFVGANRYGVASTTGFLRLLRERLPGAGPTLVGRYFSAGAVRMAYGEVIATPAPSATAIPSPSPSPTAVPSQTPTPTPTVSPTVSPSATASPSASATARPSPTTEASPTSTVAPAASATAASAPTSERALPTATTAIPPAIATAPAVPTPVSVSTGSLVAGVWSNAEVLTLGLLVALAIAGGGLLLLRLRLRR